jgi:hypothetical protein
MPDNLKQELTAALACDDIDQVKSALRALMAEASEVGMGGTLYDWQECLICEATSENDSDAPPHTDDCPAKVGSGGSARCDNCGDFVFHNSPNFDGWLLCGPCQSKREAASP